MMTAIILMFALLFSGYMNVEQALLIGDMKEDLALYQDINDDLRDRNRDLLEISQRISAQRDQAIDELEMLIERIDELKTVPAVVTAYAPFDNRSGMCTDGAPTSTSTGAYPSRGTLAADPERLPYGTQIYVPGYGEGVVEDTGGALRNDTENIRVDVFVDTYEVALAWGVREIDVIVQE